MHVQLRKRTRDEEKKRVAFELAECDTIAQEGRMGTAKERSLQEHRCLRIVVEVVGLRTICLEKLEEQIRTEWNTMEQSRCLQMAVGLRTPPS